ncbi:MAG: hypothetical protein ACI9FR_001024 [Cryomorphaceae bacterium]
MNQRKSWIVDTKKLDIFLIGVLALVSIAAGLAKLLESPQEIAFLSRAGLSSLHILMLGGLQTCAGLLLAFSKTRGWGALAAGAGLLVSSVVIFTSGNIPFGVFSLLPIAVASYVFYRARNGVQIND